MPRKAGTSIASPGGRHHRLRRGGFGTPWPVPVALSVVLPVHELATSGVRKPSLAARPWPPCIGLRPANLGPRRVGPNRGTSEVDYEMAFGTLGNMDPSPLAGGHDVSSEWLLDGKYRVGARIGKGAYAEIYRAFDTQLDRPVAIKLFTGDLSDPELLRRLEREAKIIARLRHPNIVAIHGIGYTESGAAYLVLELLEGHTLGDELDRNGPLALELALSLFRTICVAVHAANDAGVVHRDLKPDNIFLEGAPHNGIVPKVLDFGVAKIQRTLSEASESSDDTLTRPGHVIGTPYYMAPEQILGESPDARTDVYALGCVLYHMITGRPPFTDRLKSVLWRKHLMELPERPARLRADLPAHVESAILRALAKEPSDRFPTALDMSAAIGIPRRRAADLVESS